MHPFQEPADKALTYRASSPPVPAARTSLAAVNRPPSVARQQNEEAETRYVPSALSNRIDGPLVILASIIRGDNSFHEFLLWSLTAVCMNLQKRTIIYLYQIFGHICI